MFETKIKNIFVVLIEDNEEYLENRKLAVSEYNKDTLYEAELRAALNSLELSTDSLYIWTLTIEYVFFSVNKFY